MKKKTKKHCISYSASMSELVRLQRVMKYHKRKTYSDIIRYLVEMEDEKIFAPNNDIVLNCRCDETV